MSVIQDVYVQKLKIQCWHLHTNEKTPTLSWGCWIKNEKKKHQSFLRRLSARTVLEMF